MTIQVAAMILSIPGALTIGSLPYAFFINPAHMNHAAESRETIDSLPDVDLVNSAGVRIARASVHAAGRQCRVQIRSATLPSGNYRAHLVHSAKCFETRRPEAREVVDSASFAVTRNKIVTPASFLFITDGPNDSIERLIAKPGLIIQLVGLDAPAPVACGQLSRGD